MEVEVFLKEGIGIAEGGACAPPYIIHFVMDTANIPLARERAKLLLKGLDRAANRDFRDDSERAEHLISDTIAANAHTDQRVMQAIAFVLVHLCTDTPEKLAALAGGRVGKAGFLLTPGDGPETEPGVFGFRHVVEHRH